MKLTETLIKKLAPVSKPTLISDDLTTGLYLKQYPSGKITFVFRTRKGGNWRVINIGTLPLAEARQKALGLQRDDLPSNMTFGDLLDKWYSIRIEPRYAVTACIEVYVNRGKEWLGNRQVAGLKTRELVEKLQTYATVSPVAANRCLSNWKLCFDYGVEIGVLENNPLARTTARAAGGEEKTRERVLTDDEIKAMWSSGETLLRFLLLTGLRISEGQKGRHDGTLWCCDKTKNGKPHWVHLPPLALDQIEPWTISPTSIQAKLKRWCEREEITPFTPHDLRRTFATRLAGLDVAPHVVEKCLNHSMQGVMATYNRHDYAVERIAAAELWASALAQIIAKDQTSDKIPVDLDLRWHI
jgi:integrase